MELDIGSLETWFWVSGMIGTTLYALRFSLSIIGFDHALDFDSDAIGHVGSDSSFSLFSITSLTGFAMLFGWGGLTALNQFQLGNATSLVVACLCGSFAFAVTAVIGKALNSLVSEGDAFSIENSIGLRGTVYQRIGPDKMGKIQISVKDLLRELDATAGEELKSGESVEVVEVVSPTIVKVKRLEV
jgi:membrane-bound ClpP family serine protease